MMMVMMMMTMMIKLFISVSGLLAGHVKLTNRGHQIKVLSALINIKNIYLQRIKFYKNIHPKS